MPLEGKKRFMNPWKVNYSPSQRIKIAFETQEIHASNDGNMVVEIGDTTLPTPQTQKTTTVILWVYLKKDGNIHQRYGDFKHAITKAKERHLVWSVFPLYTKRIYLLVQRVMNADRPYWFFWHNIKIAQNNFVLLNI
jgi:hypothetical protein